VNCFSLRKYHAYSLVCTTVRQYSYTNVRGVIIISAFNYYAYGKTFYISHMIVNYWLLFKPVQIKVSSLCGALFQCSLGEVDE
jgi:hypothetical protein